MSYVPRLAIRRKLADPAPLRGPEIERFPAAVLLADVSGFTALTERLAQRGPEGAEEMTRALNSYFGQLIDIIGAHGGDVMKFAGDAMLVLWPVLDADVDLAEQTVRAAQCGLALQRQVGRVETIPGAPLSLHAAIGAGEMAMAHLGGVFGRWEFVVMGPALSGMRNAAHLSETGDVVLTAEAWELVSRSARGTALEAGSVRLEDLLVSLEPRPMPPYTPTPEAEAALKGFLPGAIRFRLEAGQANWLAELRPVTVLFVNLPDLGHKTPLDQAQALMHALQTSTYRFEGSINKLSVDEKGISLVAALGLPPLAHYDDPARGVGVAVAIKERLDAMGIRCSIGVASGRAFCGEVGNAQRREYTIMGDVVNLAARLMQAAAGTICCDVTTQLAADKSYQFEALPAIPLKGKTGLFAIFTPQGKIQQRLPSEVRLVGRTAERVAIAQKLQGLRERRDCGILLIEGEAGIGKSSLLGYTAAQSIALRYRTMVGSADAVEQQTPYLAWRHILYDLVGIQDADDGPTRREKVMARLSATGADDLKLAPLLNAVMPLEFSQTDVTTHLEGPVRARLTNDLVARLLKDATAKTPLVLILDDVHWMDSASWALARTVSMKVAPALLIMASRPMLGKSSAELTAMLEAGGDRIKPESMSIDEARTLVCQKLGVDQVSDEIAELIHGRTGGHPLFLEEVTFALKESGALVVEGGQCHVGAGVKDLDSLNLPNTVQGVITSRIDRLPAGEQLTLKVASVIGRIYDPRLLGDVHPNEGVRQKLLDSFALHDLTNREIVSDELKEAFKSAVTRDVAYSLLLYAQRKQVHRTVAEWHERTYEGDLAPFYALLAHHWSLADVPDKAADYLEKAGQAAERSYAYKEASTLLGDALEFDARLGQGSDPRRRLRIQQFLGKVFKGMGRQDEAKRALTEGLEAARAIADLSAEAQVLTSLGHLYSIQNEKDLALETLGRSNELCKVTGDGQERLRALQFLGRLQYRTGNSEAAIRASQEALELARTAGDLDASVHMAFLGMLYVTATVPGMDVAERMWRGVSFLQEAVAFKRKTGDKLNLNDALNLLGNAQWVLGAYRDALETFEETQQIASEMGLKYDEICARINLAIQSHELGDFPAMERHARRAQQEAQMAGYTDYALIAMALRSLSSTYLGKVADGLRHQQAAAGLLQTIPEGSRQGLEVTILPYLAERELLVGRPTEATATAERAWALLEATGVREYEQRLLTLLAELALRAGRIDEASRKYKAALELGLQVESPATVARARQGLGWLAWLRGDLDEAGQLLAEARKGAAQTGTRYLESEIACRQGNLALARNDFPVAQACLDEALRLGLDASCPHLQSLAELGLSRASAGETADKHRRWAGKFLAEQVAGLEPADVAAYLELEERRDIALPQPEGQATGH